MDNLIKVFEKANIHIEQHKAKQLLQFAHLLIENNKKYNLTAIVEPQDIYKKHFLDSILGQKYLPTEGEIVDIGCGAGFPSIPLKIMQPHLSFQLIDSVNKKINFVNMAIEQLGLTNITASHMRIESLAHSSKRQSFGCVIARAVSPLPTLIEYALPLLKVGGVFVAYKADKVDEEINLSQNALQLLGGKIKTVEKINMLEEYQRCFVVIEKVQKTPEKYPRGANKPRNSPL